MNKLKFEKLVVTPKSATRASKEATINIDASGAVSLTTSFRVFFNMVTIGKYFMEILKAGNEFFLTANSDPNSEAAITVNVGHSKQHPENIVVSCNVRRIQDLIREKGVKFEVQTDKAFEQNGVTYYPLVEVERKEIIRGQKRSEKERKERLAAEREGLPTAPDLANDDEQTPFDEADLA